MDIINYPNNSNAAKRNAVEGQKSVAEREVKKVIKDQVIIKKKNEIQKLADVFLSEDVSNVKGYIFNDVIVPAIRDTLFDIVTKGAKMIFYGAKGSSGIDKFTSSRISYRQYYDDNRRYTSSTEESLKSKFDYEDMEFASRSDAEDVLDQMDAMLEKYKRVSVLDLYDMIDVTAPFTSEKYGWTNLRDAKIIPTKGAYKLKLPKAMPLD